MTSLQDFRALSLADEPYSAYCKVCWQAVYSLWIDKTPHNGACMFGHTKIEQCAQAMEWEKFKGRIRKAVAESTPAGNDSTKPKNTSGWEANDGN